MDWIHTRRRAKRSYLIGKLLVSDRVDIFLRALTIRPRAEFLRHRAIARFGTDMVALAILVILVLVEILLLILFSVSGISHGQVARARDSTATGYFDEYD